MPTVTHPEAAGHESYSTELLTAAQIKKLIKRAKREAGLSAIEEKVITSMSGQIGNKTKGQVAIELGKSLWDIYNIRRNGLRKIAKLLHIWDEEQLFPMLGLKRGRRLPPRHTRFLQRPKETSMSDEENASVEPEEENEDDGGEAAVDEFKEYGDPDQDGDENDESEDEEDESEDEEDEK